MSKKLSFNCPVCSKSFTRYACSLRPGQTTPCCSSECRGKQQSQVFAGESNPNFGKRWSEDKRKESSERTRQRFVDRPELREASGRANRGKKFSLELIQKMHGHRSKESYSRPMSEETKRKVGEASSLKFTEEYKTKFNKTMTERGHWVPKEDYSPYKIYFIESEWSEGSFNYLTKTAKELFWSNTRKYVRDHKYGRWVGFNNKVDPRLLKHPVNCQIVTRSYNVQKRLRKDSRDADWSLEELLEAIKNYVGDYPEHEVCINLITKGEVFYE